MELLNCNVRACKKEKGKPISMIVILFKKNNIERD